MTHSHDALIRRHYCRQSGRQNSSFKTRLMRHETCDMTRHVTCDMRHLPRQQPPSVMTRHQPSARHEQSAINQDTTAAVSQDMSHKTDSNHQPSAISQDNSHQPRSDSSQQPSVKKSAIGRDEAAAISQTAAISHQQRHEPIQPTPHKTRHQPSAMRHEA